MVQVPCNQPLERDSIAQFLNNNNDIASNGIQWPSRSQEPVNEYMTENLASKCFPTLFANGKGDPTNKCRLRNVPFADAVRNLLKFAYKREDGTWFYPFAAHARFAFWALNIIQRKRAVQQAGVCLEYNENYKKYTVDEIKEILKKKDKPPGFIRQLQTYAQNVTGFLF